MLCRMCHSDQLFQYLDLGFTPPADAFLRKEQLREPEVHYPLEVAACQQCSLSQLTYVVSPEILYRHDYPYEASLTQTGRRHWSEFAATTSERFQLGAPDLVVDVGSNVGALLKCFREQGTRILGVDPASNIARLAERDGVETLCEFFNQDVARRIRDTHGPASLVTATNVFAHVDDLVDFVLGIESLLTEHGVFIFEAPYFSNLVQGLQYDTIYHEHLSYLSLAPLVRFFERFNLQIFDVQQRDIHGGSFRVHVARQGQQPVTAEVFRMLAQESSQELSSPAALTRFGQTVQEHRRQLQDLLYDLKRQGRSIAAVSAPAKGMTLLNYCRLGPETLDFATEKSTLKIGRFTPGTHIPVLADAELLARQPDYALLLAWNFAEEIMRNLSEYRQRGGRFIIPIPAPRIV